MARAPKQGQVDKLVATKRAVDAGKATKADLAKVAKESTGEELDAAMSRTGGTWH